MQAIFDAPWRRAALAGSREAVAALASAATEPLFRFCLYRVGCDRHLCEDVVQDTLVRAIRDLGAYDPERSGGDILGWLTGLARNEVRRALGGRAGADDLQAVWAGMDRELLALYGMLESRPFDDELIRRGETREMVNATMSQLPPRYGSALEAKYVHGLPVREIAADAGTTEKAVESLLARARKAFRTTFLALSRNLKVHGVA